MAKGQAEGGVGLIDADMLREFATLKKERDDLKEQLAQVEKDLGEAGGRLREQMQAAAIKSISVCQFETDAGAVVPGGTIYLHTSHYASVVADRQRDAVKAAEENGLEFMVTVQAGKLSAWAREHDIAEVAAGAKQLPHFGDLVRVYEKVDVRMRQ